MDKARFNLRTLFSSPLNRRRLLTSATATGAAGAMLGTFAPIAHAQPHPGPWDPVLGQPHEGHVPNFQTTSLSFAIRYLTASPGSSNDSVIVFPNLGGANVFASTCLTEISAQDPAYPVSAWAYFSEYSDSTGSHPINDQVTTALIVIGATSVTVTTYAYSAFVASLTTLWFYQ
jgi:hypothetical protein